MDSKKLAKLIQIIVERIPNPYRDISLNLKMFLIRTFDINKPGCSIQNLKGGVVGGSIISVILSFVIVLFQTLLFKSFR